MPKNIVVFLTDDHAQWALPAYGNDDLRTPTLDYLCDGGIRFANAFTPTPVCSPARATLYTGLYPSQHGVHDYLNTWDESVDSRDWLDGLSTLPRLLQDSGWCTGLSGKWHLGRNNVRANGFDYWYQHGDRDPRSASFDTVFDSTMRLGHERYSPHAIVDHAVDFLRVRDQDRPFLLFVGFTATHSPWSAHAERLVSQYRRSAKMEFLEGQATFRDGRLAAESLMATRYAPREAVAQYYGAVSEIDEQVGRLLDELAQQDLLDATTVIYTSDHGLCMGHHGVWGKGNATKPYNMLEESIRVPLIVYGAEGATNRQVRSEMVTHADLFVTLMELAESEADAAESDRYPRLGRSFSPLLRGGYYANWPDCIFGEYGDLRMARTADLKVLEWPLEKRWAAYRVSELGRDERLNDLDTGVEAAIGSLRDSLKDFFGAFACNANDGLNVRALPAFNKEEVWRHPDTDSIWW